MCNIIKLVYAMPAVLLGAFCFRNSYTLTTGTLYEARQYAPPPHRTPLVQCVLLLLTCTC
jgi:hypothetical protein